MLCVDDAQALIALGSSKKYHNALRLDNAFAMFVLFRRKISFFNPESFFHFARCNKDTLKCISMFFAFSNDF